MIVEVNLAEEPSDQPLSWEGTVSGPREASEYRAAAASLWIGQTSCLRARGARGGCLHLGMEIGRRSNELSGIFWVSHDSVEVHLAGNPKAHPCLQ